MKCIWIIKHYGSIPDVAGGARQYEFARGLAKRGHCVAYFLPSFSHGLHREIREFDHPLYCIEKRDGFFLVWLKSFPYYNNNWRRGVNAFHFAWQVKKMCDILSNSDLPISSPDKIMCFNLPLLTPLVVQHFAKKTGTEFYLEVGDLWPQSLVDIGAISEKNPVTWVMRLMERFLYQQPAGIITPLPGVADYVQSMGHSTKVACIGSGVNLDNYPRVPSSREVEPDKEAFTVIYTGAHGAPNDLLPVLKAFGRVKDLSHGHIHLVLVGDGVQKKMLKQYAQQKNITNVVFKDPVPKNEIPAVLAAGDAFLYRHLLMEVHKYGINPNKLNDYLCAGSPILFFADGINNIIDETGCGITVNSNDPDKMADAIIRLFEMEVSKRKKMAENARKYAENNLSIETVIEKLETALHLN